MRILTNYTHNPTMITSYYHVVIGNNRDTFGVWTPMGPSRRWAKEIKVYNSQLIKRVKEINNG